MYPVFEYLTAKARLKALTILYGGKFNSGDYGAHVDIALLYSREASLYWSELPHFLKKQAA